MGAKSKKSKPAQVSDATSHKLRNDVETVRNIYKRLRKGLDLKTLCKEADNLEKITLPTAVTRLCRAKVDLNQIADTMKEKALYDYVPRTSSPEPSFVYLREQILEVIDITREGAELYNSLLCGTLCAKLAHVLGQPLDTFKMPTRPELLADPNAELVEQVHSFLFRGRLCMHPPGRTSVHSSPSCMSRRRICLGLKSGIAKQS